MHHYTLTRLTDAHAGGFAFLLWGLLQLHIVAAYCLQNPKTNQKSAYFNPEHEGLVPTLDFGVLGAGAGAGSSLGTWFALGLGVLGAGLDTWFALGGNELWLEPALAAAFISFQS